MADFDSRRCRMQVRSLWLALWLALSLAFAVPIRAQEALDQASPCGALVERSGIRVLHTWGTPEQRGYAHGLLLGNEIARSMKSEFVARFAKAPHLLKLARTSLPRAIEYPEHVAQEIDALFLGLTKSGADLAMPELGRDFDVVDLRVANALDVFGLMGCSGFTVHGERVEGGGVLTGRNFDWPFTGPHLIDATIVLVQHAGDGKAVASVTWPGYLGTVTGINQDGVAAFLHVGSGKVALPLQPSSWPTATAARVILEDARGDDPKAAFALALDRLGYTSPPAGFLTRLVLPKAIGDDSPSGLFEADSKKVVQATRGDVCVVTNHFQGRDDGTGASKDSADRHAAVSRCIDGCIADGDHKVSIDEGWQALRSVQRSAKSFGTLHSLVFRNEPWTFELRLAEIGDGQKLIAAPDSKRRVALTRNELFARPDAPTGSAR